MNKKILLCTDGSPAADVASQYAIWLAKKLGGGIRALYVTDIRILEGPMLADLSGAIGAQPFPGLLPQYQEIQREKATVLLDAVRQRCDEQRVTCEVAHETGILVSKMLDYERDADLVVLGQRGEHAPWIGEMLGSSVERMVRASIKPCLVTPAEFREIKHLLLAHDGSPESGKALQAGIDLAVALGAETTVLTVCQREHEEEASKNLRAGEQLARERGLTVHAQLAHGHPETEILSLQKKAGVDLIVMGAYGHTRIREFVVGSTTSHVMRKATVPVLLWRGQK